MKPVRVSIRSYQVGFGDCFLLSVHYDDQTSRHVLIDYGSTGLPDNVPKDQMMRIAQDIKAFTGGKLTAVVATHRHKDHISGFTTNARHGGTGDVIASLKPELVVQPWTEHPDLEEDATALQADPKKFRGTRLSAAREVLTLGAMQMAADKIWAEVRRNPTLRNAIPALGFMGENNVKNLSAVKNLMTMGKTEYLHADQPTGLSDLLPGVDITVMGPPTVEQHAGVKTQRSWDDDEFWLGLAGASAMLPVADSNAVGTLFPATYVVDKKKNYQYPVNTRWFINRSRKLRGARMLSIVTMLDGALNNTSVILLFRVGTKSFLFPGDAQLENWQYAFKNAAYMAMLKDVDVYKVGHHGSLNATPKTLWEHFGHRSKKKTDKGRLTSIMSTMSGKHGSVANKSEVPRDTLVSELENQSHHHTTQALGPNDLFIELSFDV